MVSSQVLPRLGYPFGWQVSPFAAEVDEACYRWGERMGIYHLGDPQEYRRTQVNERIVDAAHRDRSDRAKQ